MPQRKVVVGAFASALIGTGVWAVKAWKGIDVPAEVAVYMSTLVVFAVQYMVPNAEI